MNMLATIVNSLAVILGSIIGLIFKKWIKKQQQQTSKANSAEMVLRP